MKIFGNVKKIHAKRGIIKIFFAYDAHSKFPRQYLSYLNSVKEY
jgi:hypothetical protein